MNAIFKRRSVRDFLPRSVESEKLDRILRAGFEAPSAHNRRPWEIVVVSEQKDREAVAAMSPWAKMCAASPVVLAVCVDLRRGDPEYEKNAALGFTGPNAASGEDIFWIQDISAVVENILLQISDEGLGGVWLGWYPDKARVQAFMDKFGLPPHIVPAALVALGYPSKESHSKDRFDPAKVHYGYYSG